MDLDFFMRRMETNAEAVRALVQAVSDAQARWRPNLESWSILEVINHLYDEEREDFRVHLDHILRAPDQPWPRIDPQGWVVERAYNRRELGPSLHNFLEARRASLEWLAELAAPDWEAVCEAPFGEIRAGDVLAAWVAHDLLHMRQLVELQWAYTTQSLTPYRADYAGRW